MFALLGIVCFLRQRCVLGGRSHAVWLLDRIGCISNPTRDRIRRHPVAKLSLRARPGCHIGLAIITTGANELVADIHDRMPVILAPGDYSRWLGGAPDPRELMPPFPADLMRMWPISTRVNKPENDDPSILEPIQLATDAA